MYEYQLPVSRDVEWWTPGRIEISNAPIKGWRRWILLRMMGILRRLGCKVLMNHETYVATRVETVSRERLSHLLYDVYHTMMRHGERPWFVLVPYEMMLDIERDVRDGWPHTLHAGQHAPDLNYGMGRIVFNIGPGLPVYACPWIDKLTIVPDVRDSAERYKPFSWEIREIEQRYSHDRLNRW